MSYTIAQVRRFDFSAMEAAQSAARAEVNKIDDVTNQVQSGRYKLLNGWTSDAADAAETRTNTTKTLTMTLAKEAGSKVREIGVGASDLQQAQKDLLNTVSSCRAAGFDVDEGTGKVTPKASMMPTTHVPMSPNRPTAEIKRIELEAQAAEWETQIQQALQNFAGVDARVAGLLSVAPNVMTPQAQALITQVDAGHLPNSTSGMLAALRLPSSVFDAEGQRKLALWAQGHRSAVQGWLLEGHTLNLPPAPHGGYRFEVDYQPHPDMELAYAMAVPAGLGVAALALNKSGFKPSLSGSVEDPKNNMEAEGGADEDGFDAEVSVVEPGDTNLGFSLDPEGLWATIKHTNHVGPGGAASVITELKFKNDHGGGDDNSQPQAQPAHMNPVEKWVIGQAVHSYHHLEATEHWVNDVGHVVSTAGDDTLKVVRALWDANTGSSNYSPPTLVPPSNGPDAGGAAGELIQILKYLIDFA